MNTLAKAVTVPLPLPPVGGSATRSHNIPSISAQLILRLPSGWPFTTLTALLQQADAGIPWFVLPYSRSPDADSPLHSFSPSPPILSPYRTCTPTTLTTPSSPPALALTTPFTSPFDTTPSTGLTSTCSSSFSPKQEAYNTLATKATRVGDAGESCHDAHAITVAEQCNSVGRGGAFQLRVHLSCDCLDDDDDDDDDGEVDEEEEEEEDDKEVKESFRSAARAIRDDHVFRAVETAEVWHRLGFRAQRMQLSAEAVAQAQEEAEAAARAQAQAEKEAEAAEVMALMAAITEADCDSDDEGNNNNSDNEAMHLRLQQLLEWQCWHQRLRRRQLNHAEAVVGGTTTQSKTKTRMETYIFSVRAEQELLPLMLPPVQPYGEFVGLSVWIAGTGDSQCQGRGGRFGRGREVSKCCCRDAGTLAKALEVVLSARELVKLAPAVWAPAYRRTMMQRVSLIPRLAALLSEPVERGQMGWEPRPDSYYDDSENENADDDGGRSGTYHRERRLLAESRIWRLVHRRALELCGPRPRRRLGEDPGPLVNQRLDNSIAVTSMKRSLRTAGTERASKKRTPAGGRGITYDSQTTTHAR